ncbi:MAG: hypothetical protein AAF626_04850 [Pseudomonadota bacterium]
MTALIFDTWGDETVSKNYFHFKLGYLLPVASHCLRNRAKILARSEPVICRSCSPALDAVLHQLAEILCLPIELEDKAAPIFRTAQAKLMPRWDMHFGRRRLLDIAENGVNDPDRRPVATQPAIDARNTATKRPMDRLRQRFFLRASCARVDKEMQVVRHALQNRLGIEQRMSENQASSVLILRRAPSQPQSQERDIVSGAARRALVGTDTLQHQVTSIGLPADVYEPGSDTLRGQIKRFSQCRGVIALRGAEIANCFWMARGAFLIIANPKAMGRLHRMHNRFFERLGLSVQEIEPLFENEKDYRISANQLEGALETVVAASDCYQRTDASKLGLQI